MNTINNIIWERRGKIYGVTWHKLISGEGANAQCEPDDEWNAMAFAEQLKQTLGVHPEAEVAAVDMPIVFEAGTAPSVLVYPDASYEVIQSP